jgi:hypothetical protein
MAIAKLFLAVEAALLAAAALVHSGIVLPGFEHGRAATAEGVIAAVLACSLVLSQALPARAGAIALAAQLFAVAATLVGAFTIAIGVGPRTAGDIVFHGLLLVILAAGLVLMLRRRLQSGE